MACILPPINYASFHFASESTKPEAGWLQGRKPARVSDRVSRCC